MFLLLDVYQYLRRSARSIFENFASRSRLLLLTVSLLWILRLLSSFFVLPLLLIPSFRIAYDLIFDNDDGNDVGTSSLDEMEGLCPCCDILSINELVNIATDSMVGSFPLCFLREMCVNSATSSSRLYRLVLLVPGYNGALGLMKCD